MSILHRPVGIDRILDRRLRLAHPRMTGGLRALRHPPDGARGADGILHVAFVQKEVRRFRIFRHRPVVGYCPMLALSLGVPLPRDPPLVQVRVGHVRVVISVHAFVAQSVLVIHASVFARVVSTSLAYVVRNVGSILVLVRMRPHECFWSS